MACKKCGSDWVTKTGRDCASCPHCDKQQRCLARKQGLWVEPTAIKQCKACGKHFECVGLDAINRLLYCGAPQCYAIRKANNRKAQQQRKQRGVASKKRRCISGRTCKRCGAPLTASYQTAYCSRQCAGADAKERKRPVCGMSLVGRFARDLAEWFLEWEQQRPKPHPLRIQRAPCEVCGAECNHLSSRVCSMECVDAWRGIRMCPCGRPVPNSKMRGRVSCDSCKRQARKKAKRHAQKELSSYRKRCRRYGGHYNPKCKREAILERDKWRCHSCNCKTLSLTHLLQHGLPLWHPRAATVDHFPVPLSKGGDHDWDNVRCACRKCNSERGAQWDKQRRLRFV